VARSCRRVRRGLAAIAFGGHANSASPRTLALLTDWIHLLAGTVWAGGIAQIVIAWLPRVRRLADGQRLTVIGGVLERFGGIALPAFAVVVAAGIANAWIELGRPAELWSIAYGRVLLVKIALVAVIGALSYVHAFRLRPRVLEGETPRPAERRLWRLLSGEPALLSIVLVIAALLAVFPLPPRQLLERAEAERPAPSAAASGGPPRAAELATAEDAGPWIAAAWVAHSGRSVRGTVRLLDFNVHPVPAAIRMAGARVRPCGAGCASFQRAGSPAVLRVTARRGRSAHTALIPVRWDPGQAATAERVLRRAVALVRRLHSFRIAERLAGGLGGGAALSRTASSIPSATRSSPTATTPPKPSSSDVAAGSANPTGHGWPSRSTGRRTRPSTCPGFPTETSRRDCSRCATFTVIGWPRSRSPTFPPAPARRRRPGSAYRSTPTPGASCACA